MNNTEAQDYTFQMCNFYTFEKRNCTLLRSVWLYFGCISVNAFFLSPLRWRNRCHHTMQTCIDLIKTALSQESFLNMVSNVKKFNSSQLSCCKWGGCDEAVEGRRSTLCYLNSPLPEDNGLQCVRAVMGRSSLGSSSTRAEGKTSPPPPRPQTPRQPSPKQTEQQGTVSGPHTRGARYSQRGM